MAKESMKARYAKRLKLINKYKAKREQLKKEGYKLPNSTTLDSRPDGIYGPETKAALIDWQTKNRPKIEVKAQQLQVLKAKSAKRDSIEVVEKVKQQKEQQQIDRKKK